MIHFVRKTLIATAFAAAFGAGNVMAADTAPKTDTAPKADAVKVDAPKVENPFKTDKENISYMVGMDVGKGLSQIKDEIDINMVMQAMQAVLKGDKTAMTPEQAQKVKQDFMQKLQAKHVAEEKAAAEKNKKEGEEFLAKNKSKSGVKTTASGLQYEVEKAGDGPKPKATDTVKVNYVGTKIDGTKFDSSYDRNQPATFPLNGVIPGWGEGLQLMPVGSKYKFYIPASIAYGERGPGNIGPNATLIFEVELLSIEKPADKPADAKPGDKPAVGKVEAKPAPAAKTDAKPADKSAEKK